MFPQILFRNVPQCKIITSLALKPILGKKERCSNSSLIFTENFSFNKSAIEVRVKHELSQRSHLNTRTVK